MTGTDKGIVSTSITRTSARILGLLGLVTGIYVMLHGHLSPGGGFPGGAIVGSGLGLVLLCGALYPERESIEGWHVVKGLAALGLLLIIVTAVALRSVLLSTQELFSVWGGGVTLLANLAGGLMVSIGMLVLVYSVVVE